MTLKEISEIFKRSSVIFPNHVIDSDDAPWYSPPGWNGVFLKDLICDTDTDGKFSYHLVRILEYSQVPDHHHDSQWEWNLVVGGNGYFEIESEKIQTKSGQVFATPPGVSHAVYAGDEDLFLIAVFVPALVS